MITILCCAAAHAAGLLYDEAGYAALTSLDAQVEVRARVATVTATYRFAESELVDPTFVAVLPEDAAVAGLSYRLGGGLRVVAGPQLAEAPDRSPDGDLSALIGGRVFATALPDTLGRDLEVRLQWQAVLAADRGELSLAVPLDDGGLNPSEPTVSLSWSVEGAMGLLGVNHEPSADVSLDGLYATARWSGTLDDAAEARLSWSEETSPLGVQLFTYRPAVDPFTGGEGEDGYALLVIQPGDEPDARVPQLFTFVLDTSSSMAGAPLDAAVQAGSDWVAALDPDDRFDIVSFASQAHPFRARAQAAGPEAVDDAVRFLEHQQALGLSDPEEALELSLDLMYDTVTHRGFLGCQGSRRGESGDLPPLPGAEIVADDDATAPYLVLLTDGGASAGVTDTDAILDAVAQANVVGASIFAIGVGPDVDMDLLDRLTRAHRGSVVTAPDADAVPDAVALLRDRIADPMLVRPVMQVQGAAGQAPRLLEDLAAGRELVVAFRYAEPGTATATLSGIRGQGGFSDSWDLLLPEVSPTMPVVARAWAQLRVADLDAAYDAGDRAVLGEIEDLVATYGVASDVVSLGFGYAADETADAVAWGEDTAAGCGCAIGGGRGPWLLGLGALLTWRRRGSRGAATTGAGARR